MKKYIVLACLLSALGVKGVLANQEKNIVQALLTEGKHFTDDLPVEMQQEIASWLFGNHPSISFLLRKIPTVEKKLSGNSRWVMSARFNSSESQIVTASGCDAKIWDVTTGDCLHELTGHSKTVRSAEFNHAGDRIVTASLDRTAMIWDAINGSCLQVFEGHQDGVTRAHFNASGDKIVTASEDGTSKIYDVLSGTCLHSLTGHLATILSATIFSARFNRSGTKVVTASQDTTSKIWDTLSGACLNTLVGHTDGVVSAQFNDSGEKVVTASQDGTARIWDVATGTCIHILSGHTKQVSSAEFNKQGDKVVTASHDGTSKIWAVNDGTCLLTLKGHRNEIRSARFNTTGDTVVTASDDCFTKIWDVASGRCLQTLGGGLGGDVISAEFNSSGTGVVAALRDSTARIWDLSRVCSLKRFLQSELTLRQAVLLKAIYETIICRALVKRSGTLVFLSPEFYTLEDLLTVDFNEYPFLKEAFTALPREIQVALRPYVTEVFSPGDLRTSWELYEKIIWKMAMKRYGKLVEAGNFSEKKKQVSFNFDDHPFIKQPFTAMPLELFVTLPQEIQVALKPFILELPNDSQDDDNENTK